VVAEGLVLVANNHLTPEQIADRLADYSSRLYSGSITRARSLWGIWSSYNSPENPLRAIGVDRSRSAVVVNILATATLHETIMIAVRALDDPGRSGLFKTNRVSFPVLAGLADQAGVRAELRSRARVWIEDGWQADQNEEICLNALNSLNEHLERLQHEEPNRQKLLRDFRDEFLAHNLEFESDRARPLIGDITSMLEELTQLSNLAQLAFNGASTVWEPFQQDISRLADLLWRQIRDGSAQAN
jgi:hypothetical protein